MRGFFPGFPSPKRRAGRFPLNRGERRLCLAAMLAVVAIGPAKGVTKGRCIVVRRQHFVDFGSRKADVSCGKACFEMR